MSDVLARGAMAINRRRFLGRALAGTFAVLAGAAAGRTERAWAISCTAPNGACPSAGCNGYRCRDSSGLTCNYRVGACAENRACWCGGGHCCCDCRCCTLSACTSCYCHGVQ